MAPLALPPLVRAVLCLVPLTRVGGQRLQPPTKGTECDLDHWNVEGSWGKPDSGEPLKDFEQHIICAGVDCCADAETCAPWLETESKCRALDKGFGVHYKYVHGVLLGNPIFCYVLTRPHSLVTPGTLRKRPATSMGGVCLPKGASTPAHLCAAWHARSSRAVVVARKRGHTKHARSYAVAPAPIAHARARGG